MKEWVTISEAAHYLGITERAVRYRIDKGNLESKIDGEKRLVLVEISSENSSEELLKELVQEKDSQIEQLKGQLSEKDDQISELHQLLAIAQKNIQSVTEQNQLLLEDLRPKQRWYHRMIWWKEEQEGAFKTQTAVPS